MKEGPRAGQRPMNDQSRHQQSRNHKEHKHNG
jgi:hypothetical protein